MAQRIRPEVDTIHFEMPGLRIGSVTDSTLSTGATLFLFPRGSTANFDARGGSIASIETQLLEESSYSNEIDGILFAGGSTMGLEATQGVRRRIFKARAKEASNFDFIPSIPGAVVYDYSHRPEPGQHPLVFPTLKLGATAYDRAVENQMLVGRVGAGTSTTTNKKTEAIWGGQGGAIQEISFAGGSKGRLFAAVVVNARGDISDQQGHAISKVSFSNSPQQDLLKADGGPKRNTTLSLIVTDISLDRSQLKRLATMVHTSMARQINPFHTYTDGDILFAVSMNQKSLPSQDRYKSEEILQNSAAEAMGQAIVQSVTSANRKK